MSRARRMPPPLRHIEAMTKIYEPGIWGCIDAFMDAPHSSSQPDVSPLSARVWAACMKNHLGAGEHLASRHGCILTALAMWRRTALIYAYDRDAARSIAQTRMSGSVPIERLYRLPAPCIYVSTYGAQDMRGFFAMLDTLAYAPDALIITFDFYQNVYGDLALEPEGLAPFVVNLPSDPRLSVEEIVARQTHIDTGRDLAAELLHPCLNLLLYLTSDRCDREPSPVRTRRPTVALAHPLQTWNVGWRVGSALRAARHLADKDAEEGPVELRARPRAHIRRAHWHTYWKGPRDGAREAVVRWMPPMGINLADGDIVPTQHAVPAA